MMYQIFFVCVFALLGIESTVLHMPASSPSQVASRQLLHCRAGIYMTARQPHCSYLWALQEEAQAAFHDHLTKGYA